MEPICVPCGRRMVCKKIGAFLKTEMGGYKVGDIYQCPDCKAKTMTGICVGWRQHGPSNPKIPVVELKEE